MQKIIPHLWFDHQAEIATDFYCSIFKDSEKLSKSLYGEAGSSVSGMPAGSVLTINFKLAGQEFLALNGGPVFQFTPAISFFVNCDTKEEVNAFWDKLSEKGLILMELGSYPFSDQFGWVMDQFGVSWQLNLGSRKQKITPFLMFVGDQYGKAEAAMNYYISLFQQSGIQEITRNEKDDEDSEGTVKHAIFSLGGQEFMAMDSGGEHHFTFTEALSLFVNCETQQEIDLLWEKLSEGGEKVECGWLKDKFGVSWQIVPTVLGRLLNDPDTKKTERVMKAMLQMQKLDIALLEKACEQ